MHQPRAYAGRLRGDHRRSDLVDRGGDVRLGLGSIDRGVGGGVDDQVRAKLAHQGDDGVGIGEIEGGAVAGHDPPERGQGLLELPSELPPHSGQRDDRTLADSRLRRESRANAPSAPATRRW